MMYTPGKRDNGQENGIKTKHTEMLWETVLSRRASECARNKAQGKSPNLKQKLAQSLQDWKGTKVYVVVAGWQQDVYEL